MVENVSRKIVLILSLLALGIASLLIGGFRLGLDLEGGTRLVYSLDLKEALDKGHITQQEYQNPTKLWNEIRRILLERLDPNGVREPVIRLEGEQRFVIELPGSAAGLRKSAEAPLAEAITADARSLTLDATPEVAENFPTRGAQIRIEDEVIRYARRLGTRLDGLERNYGDASVASEHAAGSTVRLIALDPWRDKIENIASMQFLIRAKSEDLAGSGTDLTGEIEAAKAWADDEANANASIDEYNQILADREGPVSRLRFYPLLPKDKQGNLIEGVSRGNTLQPLIIDENPKWRFTGADVDRFFYTTDKWGKPAVGFQMKTHARTAFGDFTGAHIDEPMAIVINDEIATMPNIDARLPGEGIITGDFSIQEANDLVVILRSGSLPLKPHFEGQETVGASLGDAYVKRGFLGIGLGLILVLAFMVGYYKRLGVFAAISLLVNLVLLMGALAFLQATLTLPGVAGILLTVGMAVDANILIYERIREEAARGRKPLQSAKDGFAHALSTIVDANLTTLISAIILYKLGTGPVRGFATTLSIGILTSMFSALVVTRVLVHLQLERGIDRFAMAQWIANANYKFMAHTRAAVITSGTLIVLGVGFFLSLSTEEKYGIDFLGGMTMTVSLAESTTASQVSDWIKALDESEDTSPELRALRRTIANSAEVKPIRNSAKGDGYTRFRITAKGSKIGIEANAGASETEGKLGKSDTNVLDEFRRSIGEALAGKLAPGPVEDVKVENGQASGLLYLERQHDDAALKEALAKIGVNSVTLEAVPDRGEHVVRFTGTVTGSISSVDLRNAIQEDLSATKDATGHAITLANPIDEVNAVGAQVVSELRDNSILAVLLSLFAVVMYIRVRFAEYSFGFAAVTALAHDVLFTLGMLAVADEFIPFIDTEINLPMIAAFLTIIGYSLNDTIVVFDRIRENLPRMKGSLSEIIDASINQCLSRTVLTSLTTLFSVLMLLAFNVGTGNVIEGFAFSMLIGVVVGTYSSMFIASPVLLYLETRRQRSLAEDDPTKHGSKAAAGS